MPVRVLLLNNFAQNGQATHVFALGRELSRQGHRVHLLMPDFPEEYREKYGKFLDYLGCSVSVNDSPEEIARLLEKYRFDILHAHSPLTYNLARSLSKACRAPYVLSCHGLGIAGERYEESLAAAGKLLCISPRVADSLARYQEKTAIIPNGIDTREYAPGKKNHPVKILYAGRVDQYKRKGFLALEKALGLCHASSLSFEYYCAANVSSSFRGAKSLGWVPSIAPYANNSDIIIGTGRALLEGMAAGNAACILGRMWGGVVTPGQVSGRYYFDFSGMTGREACYRNIFFDLAKLMKNTRRLRELQQFGREHVLERYDITRHTRQVVKIYEGLVSPGA